LTKHRAADLFVNKQGELVAHTAPAPAGVERLIDLGSRVARVQDGLDVAHHRERTRQRRISRVAVLFSLVAVYLWWRILAHLPLSPVAFHLTATQQEMLPSIFIVIILGGVLLVPLLGAGRSPHIRYQPSEINTGFSDVVGMGNVKEEVMRSLNLFLAYRTFREEMGGNPRKAMLFEGPPGTGKTYMAKAMAREAGVPFLFVSATAFQSMYYGQTSRKIRSYFRELRKAAREEGGAIGFIEEIDAIAGARAGMGSKSVMQAFAVDHAGTTVERSGVTEGVSGVVNELLVQLQSFDTPTYGARMRGVFVQAINRFLPVTHHIKKHTPDAPNILVIAATNRASDLDPALLRPGRFDRSIHFGLPSRSGRREIVDYYLERKAHVPDLDREDRREQLAAVTLGYSPVMIEHVLDEALVWALRSGRNSMEWSDVHQAKMTEEIGLKQPVEYTDHEKETIAVHEAGHAVVAHLLGGDTRKLEVLSIIKRRDALGLLAHSETEERFTATRSELMVAIHIAFGGMTAEELFFGESGTGPASDLAHATSVAARMVGSFGMAGSLMSFEAIEAGPLSQGIVAKVLADESGRAAVETILDGSKADVRALLDENRHLVVALRDALLERSELIGDEIVDVLNANAMA
jgi:ATP-dependent Zn protease